MAQSAAWAQELLRQQCLEPIGTLEPLFGGAISQAFAFRTAAGAYVLRVSAEPSSADSFARDTFAANHFASPTLPIPPIVAHGLYEGLPFAISERAVGGRLSLLPTATQQSLIPALLDTVEAIGRADLQQTTGYGGWSATGVGQATSWREHLLAVRDDHPDGYYQYWHRLFDTTFLERSLFDAVYQRLARLIDFAPEARCLVHGDLHFDNILATPTRITAIIDWGNASFGDALYDIAWLGRPNAAESWLIDPTILAARFGATPHYQERIACYQCYLGLDDLRYYARNGYREQYEAIKGHLLKLLANS